MAYSRLVLLAATILCILATGRVVSGGTFDAYTTCDTCVAAGFGWHAKKNRCGGFPTKSCPPPAIVSPIGFKPATDKLPTRVRTLEFTHSPQVFVDDSDPAPVWDNAGYIITHYCQGRFGNQVDYLLNLIEVAKLSKRTLVLPPFTDYTTKETMGVYPYFWYFTDIFSSEKLASYGVKVIDLGVFIAHFKEKWAEFGYVGHCTYPDTRPEGWADNCMTDDSPKEPFWRNLGIKFDSYDMLPTPSHRMIKKVKHPVVALDCSGGSYPAAERLDPIAKFLVWSDPIRLEALAFIKANLPRPYVGAHIRQAFIPACERGMIHSSSQCLPFLPDVERIPNVAPTYPPEVCSGGGSKGMDALLSAVVKSLGGTKDQAADKWSGVSVFVASDSGISGFLLNKFGAKSIEGGLTDTDTGFLRPQVDLAVLDLADHMIGHCPSSFSHTVTRMRMARGMPVSFWGVPGSLPDGAVIEAETADAAEHDELKVWTEEL